MEFQGVPTINPFIWVWYVIPGAWRENLNACVRTTRQNEFMVKRNDCAFKSIMMITFMRSGPCAHPFFPFDFSEFR